MRFAFATVRNIIFGAGTLAELEHHLLEFGKRALVVTGRDPERARPLLDILDDHKVEQAFFEIEGEPTVQQIRMGTARAREASSDFVIGFGGGSVIDTAKAVAALLTNDGDPLDYLEVIGKGQSIRRRSAPFVAIPTTAGTGSEVTSNAVLASHEHRVKVSLRSPLMLARLALVDSTLTRSTPPNVTAASGLDALTQVIEPFVSNRANPMTDAICREGIHRAARSLRDAYDNGDDFHAREAMSLVSLFGGLALSNAKLGAVHGFAGPFGGMFDAPHGAICARLLPFVTEVNIAALRQRQPESDTLHRYDEVAQLLTGKAQAAGEEGVQFLKDLISALHIAPLSAYGLAEADFPVLIEKASAASSMKGNPIQLTPEEMQTILEQAL